MSPRRKKDTGAESSAPFAYDGLSRILHEKARLGILTALLTRPEGHLFNDLKELCSLTDGNLSRHVQVLHEAGLVQVWKSTASGRPKTLVRISPDGRKQFIAYLQELEQVIHDARHEASSRASRRIPDSPPGFSPA
jgi:DNA-binding MarR family transcriptional regulator